MDFRRGRIPAPPGFSSRTAFAGWLQPDALMRRLAQTPTSPGKQKALFPAMQISRSFWPHRLYFFPLTEAALLFGMKIVPGGAILFATEKFR